MPVQTCSADTIETQDLTQRELILRVFHQVTEMNGTQRRLLGDFYGDPSHQIEGIKPCVQDHDRTITRARTAVKVVGTIVGGLISAEGVAIIVMLAR